MKINEFGDCIIDPDEIFRGIYTGEIRDLNILNIDDKKFIDDFNRAIRINGDEISPLKIYEKPKCSVIENDLKKQENWLLPYQYQEMDIEQYLFSKCQTDLEKNRVKKELILFKNKGMIPLLRYLKYLVDLMKDNNIVWGLGRGSSVASYCLYLLEVHQIDSIKYELDIEEFLRPY